MEFKMTMNKYDRNAVRKYVAWIDLCTYCNAGCPQCHRTNPNGLDKVDWLPLTQWSIDEFKRCFTPKDMLKIRKFEICGTWGDPMMCKDIYKIIEYIVNESTAFMHINTNGSIRDEDFWWKLGVLAKNRLEVYFDIEGINQEMHSKYRQKTDFEKLKENIQAYTATGAKANAHIIVFKHNEDYLYDILHMIDNELGIKGDVIIQASNRFHQEGKQTFIDQTGNEVTIEEVTNKDHPLLQNIVPSRDHEWWKKIGSKKMNCGLWTPSAGNSK
jgi:molybdenum cofactor biosynthesis enzyme MoaA